MAEKFDIVSMGAGLVDVFMYTDVHEQGKFMCYNIGAKLQIQKSHFDVGGGAINTSTTFSRMGLKTGMLSKIGKDAFGCKILEKLKKEKVKFLGRIDSYSGYSIILDSIEHDRTILTFKGANDLLKPGEFQVPSAKWFYFSSMAKDSFQSQIKIAKSKKNKYKIAFNPSLYLFHNEDVKSLIKLVDVLIVNNEEADMISSDHKKIISLGPQIVIVTNGKEPFLCYTKEKTYKIYPHENIKIIERTGAGDAFASGFVAGYIKTRDIEQSLQIGVANSESVVKYMGSTNIILSWPQAQKAVKSSPCKVEIV
jgi:ribokinase